MSHFLFNRSIFSTKQHLFLQRSCCIYSAVAQLVLRWINLIRTLCLFSLCVDSLVQGPIAVPHLVPLLMAMEGDDPVENSERGCQLLYNILQSARNVALHAHDYQQHARSLLTGTCAGLEEHSLTFDYTTRDIEGF